MAAAPEHRGGFLKRRILLAALLAAGAAAWTFQSGIVAAAARRLAGPGLKISGSAGGVLRGFSFSGISFSAGGVSVSAGRLFIKPDVLSLFRGRLSVSELRVVSAAVEISEAPGEAASSPAKLPGWLPDISSGSLSGASLKFSGNAPPAEIETCIFTLRDGRLELRGCAVSASGVSALLAGSWDGVSGSFSGPVLYPPGSASAGMDVSFGPERGSVAAAGVWGKMPFELLSADGGGCRFTRAKDGASLDGCLLRLNGAEAGFSAAFSGGAAEAVGRAVHAAEGIGASFSYRLSGEEHALSADGVWRGVPLTAQASLKGDAWRLKAAVSGAVPEARLPEYLRGLQPLSGEMSASGRGFSFAAAGGSGGFRTDAGGLSANGSFSFEGGDITASASVSSGPLSGEISGRLAGGRISGGWLLSSADGFSVPRAAFDGLDSSGTFSGSPGAPAVRGSASSPGFSAGRLTAGWTSLSFGLDADRRFGLELLAADVSAGGRRAGRLALSAGGVPGSHSFSAGLSGGSAELSVSGEGALDNGAWKGRVSALDAGGSGWELCGPFGLYAAAGGDWSVSGLCLASPSGRASLSASARAGTLTGFSLSASGLDLSLLDSLGLFPLPASGRLEAEASYASGAPGTFRAEASGVRLDGLEVGDASASGSFGPGEVKLDEGEWRLYGGRVGVSGFMRGDGEDISASFSLTASTANVAPLLAFFPGFEADEAWLSGAGSVAVSGGRMRTSGGLNLRIPRLSSPPNGLLLEDVRAELIAVGLTSAGLRVSAAGKGGRAAAEGTVSSTGPYVRGVVTSLPFAHPTGLSARASGQFLLAGGWKEPALSGELDLSRARFEMKKWEKYSAPEERSAFYESLEMEMRVKVEKNAWYREGASAVELKGDLFLRKEPYQPVLMLGTVEAVRGSYVYLGKSFTVDSAKMVFSGEYPPDPQISAEASSGDRGAPYKVYFTASGTMLTPRVTLSSDPAMEERDIISYLVTGKPLYELRSSGRGEQGARGDRTAQNLAAGYLSQQASATVGRKLDLDVVSLKMTQESQADITVGRYVTKDLFISYGQVLGPVGEKRVSAEYSLTRHLSLEGKNSSDGRYGADLLFKFGIR